MGIFLVTLTVKNLPAIQETQVQSLGQEEGNGHPLQYSYLENSMDREAWGIVVHGVAEWEKTERLTLYFVTFITQL